MCVMCGCIGWKGVSIAERSTIRRVTATGCPDTPLNWLSLFINRSFCCTWRTVHAHQFESLARFLSYPFLATPQICLFLPPHTSNPSRASPVQSYPWTGDVRPSIRLYAVVCHRCAVHWRLGWNQHPGIPLPFPLSPLLLFPLSGSQEVLPLSSPPCHCVGGESLPNFATAVLPLETNMLPGTRFLDGVRVGCPGMCP